MSNELTTVFEDLIELVSRAVPKAQQISKYGGIVFTVKPDEKEGQFCGVFPYKSHVQLSISQGALLEAVKGIELEGNGKFRRHINFRSSDTINESALKKLIVQSSKL